MNSGRLKNSASAQKVAAKAASWGVALLAGYLIADLAVLYARQYMVPSQAPPQKPRGGAVMANNNSYQKIQMRNMFSADGKIPPKQAAKAGQQSKEQDLPPVLSQLPLTLMGTLVHSDPAKSLAAIDIKGKNSVLSFRPGQNIETMATVEKVERMKVFLRNRNSGRLEYIEMKNAPKLSLRTSSAPEAATDVRKTSENEFEIKRGDLVKYTSNLGDILNQARAIPARRGGTGDIYGFRLVEMQPNSIYTKLGLQVQDVITGVNGSPVTSINQAMQQYKNLQSAENIEIQVERGGQMQTLKYRIAR